LSALLGKRAVAGQAAVAAASSWEDAPTGLPAGEAEAGSTTGLPACDLVAVMSQKKEQHARASSAWQCGARAASLTQKRETGTTCLTDVVKAAEAQKKHRRSQAPKLKALMGKGIAAARDSKQAEAFKQQLAKRKAAVDEAIALAKQGDWRELVSRARQYQKQTVSHYTHGLAHGLREEHTVVSMLFPLDVDTSGNNLTDTQLIQVFWNELATELVMLAVLFSPSGGGGYNPIVAIMDAMLVVGPVTVGAILFRQIFKWGNRGKREGVKRERQVAANDKVATAAGAKTEARGKATRAGLTDKASLSRRRFWRKLRSTVRWVTAWAIVVSANVVMLLMLMIFASQTFGPEATNKFLLSWTTAAAVAWLLIEPLEVCFIVFLPFLLDNKYVANVRFYLKETGVI